MDAGGCIAALERHCEVLYHERTRAEAKADRIFAILMGIHHLLCPKDVEVGGITYRFVPPEDPMYRDAYRLLSESIREIPDKISKVSEHQPESLD